MARLYVDRYPETLDWANADGKTALHMAAERGNEELVQVGVVHLFSFNVHLNHPS